MTPSLEHYFLEHWSLPVDDALDLRLQERWHTQMVKTLDNLKTIVKHTYTLPQVCRERLLWEICFIETHLENQTQDMQVSLKAGCN